MKTLISAAIIAAVAGTASAADLARWTFESSVPSSAGPHAAEAGIFAASSQASGSHISGATVYSNPVGNGSAESFSSNNWAIGDYYQFRTSSIGYDTLTFGWSQISSSSGPANFAIQWSADGSTFNSLQNYVVTADSGTFWSSGAPVASTIYAPVALPAAANNLANVWVRLTALSAPGGTSGTNRVDDVYVSGTLVPTPGAMTLMGLAGLVAARRRRA